MAIPAPFSGDIVPLHRPITWHYIFHCACNDEWKKVIKKLGRWADMENDYKTMDKSYMESVWWVFKQLWDNGQIYESYRSMHICPRCETTLSQSEVAEGYRDVKDLSVIAKFELIDEPGTFVLAWTTTPWTLIGNVALAIGEDFEYIKVKIGDEYYILEKELSEKVLKDKEYDIITQFKGHEIVGKRYKPLFDYYYNKNDLENRENGWKIVAGEFVTTEDGTGVVHIAPAFGEDDMNLGKKENLPFIQHVGMDGIIKSEAIEFAGMSVKPIDDHTKTDVEIVRYLAGKNTLFHKEKFEHSYPHCWRCDTPLLNYATSSWFVNIEKIKENAIENAKEINWFPAHIKNGRWGKWLEGARDWSISRQRYWASVIPIWRCECGEIKVYGGVEDLERDSGQKVDDLHKDVVDKIEVTCPKCNQKMKRIPDVLDTWFDSGSMPYAQKHYPFEQREEFDKTFPAEFIAEGVDQTRAWFYYLHVISTSIMKKPAFKNVIVNGIVLAEDGKKMSKRLQNYPDPVDIIDKYGADSLRFYLLSSPVMGAENINFKESEIAELNRGMFRMLWNSYSFFVLYANIDGWTKEKIKKIEEEDQNVLDSWILSELNTLTEEVNKSMKMYDLSKTVRNFPKFIDNLSNWYIRRSRKRFWKSENDQDKDSAYQTLWTVLTELSKLMAPFTPFISDEIYRNLTGELSVHLCDYPKTDKNMQNKGLNEEMDRTRKIVENGLSERASSKIKVRQPLSELKYGGSKLREEFEEIIAEEINVKKVSSIQDKDEDKVELNTEISDDLKVEGLARELIRNIQSLRKSTGLEVDDRIRLTYYSNSSVMNNCIDKMKDLIVKEVLALSLNQEENNNREYREFIIDGESISISIEKA